MKRNNGCSLPAPAHRLVRCRCFSKPLQARRGSRLDIKSGTRLGRYEIRSSIGSGGMGEVFLAEDRKLDRKVALKVLPQEVAAKQERMARFVREAKSAAALNHPNIAHVYEIDEVDGQHFIAMEFIDGVTLRQKIYGGSELPRLLRYLQQVAEGLAKAHAAGIVHRDLKPDNIMITRDGYAKILDFGLAKLIEPQVSTLVGHEGLSEVATAMMPQHSLPGTVMGTIGYMSPEQAQGKVNEIDHRSDIFAFGCLLYEATTRQKAFKGKDALDSLHNIVHAPTPQIKDINPVAPDDLQRIVRRCLAKDPEKRYQSIKDVAIELDEVRQELKESSELHDSVHQTASGIDETVSGRSDVRQTVAHSASYASQVQSSPPTSSAKIIINELTRNKGVLVLGLLVILVVAGGAGWFVWHKFGARSVPRVSSGTMKFSRLVTGAGRVGAISVSPDGKYVAYAVYAEQSPSLWVRQVSQDTSLQVVPPVEDAFFQSTSFSPDGELIYFVAGNLKTDTFGSLYQVPVIGGREPRKILERVTGGLSISPDGKRVAFLRYSDQTDESALMVANLDGSGEPNKLSTRRTTDWFTDFCWSPDGQRIVAAQASAAGGVAYSLVEIPVNGGPEKAMTDHKWSGEIAGVHWLVDGTGLVIAAAERFGDPIQYFYLSLPGGDLRRITSDLNEYGSFGVTNDSKTIVANLGERSSKIWTAAPGASEAEARKISNGRRDGAGSLAWTPDGRIVFTALAGANVNIWIMNADGTGVKPVTSHAFQDSFPTVSSDGRFIVFQSFRPDNLSHIWRVDIDGSNLKQLTTNEDNTPSLSPDGRWVLFHSWRTGSPTLWKIPVEGGEQQQISKLRLSTPISFTDGKTILCEYYDDKATPPRERPALVSAETGEMIRVIESSPNSSLTKIAPGDRELLFVQTTRDISNIWSQPITGGAPKQLTRFSADFIASFAMSRDGKQLAVSRQTGSNEIILIKDFK